MKLGNARTTSLPNADTLVSLLLNMERMQAIALQTGQEESAVGDLQAVAHFDLTTRAASARISQLQGALHFPLAYREGNDYTRLGNRGGSYEQTDRPGPGHPGPAYPEDSCVRAAQRLGDRATPEAGLRRRPAGERRIALPRPAQAGARGLDYC